MLINRDGTGATATLGDELTPSGFKAVKLSAGQLAVRRILFGSDPDQYLLNYRTRQLLALIHASPLVEYVTALDPRITYRFDTVDLFSDGLFTPQVTRLAATTTELRVFGEPSPPDISGRMRHSIRVEFTDSDTLVTRQLYPPSQNFSEVVYGDGASNKIRLGDSGYEFRVAAGGGTGDAWLVECLNRPQWDLSQLVANLERVGETALLQVFGLSRDEPYATFRNLWNDNRELPLRLGALTLALIYSTEARRG